MRTASAWAVRIGVLQVVCASQLFAQTTNRWTSSAGGNWDTPSSWSAGTPTINNGLVLISNAVSKTITLDSSVHLFNLSINNLTVSGPAGTVNTLQLLDMRKTLQVLNGISNAAGSSLVITDSTLTVGTNGMSADGTVTLLSDGLLQLTESLTTIGNDSAGTMVIRGGTAQMGDFAIGESSLGTLTMSGGTTTLLGSFSSALIVGDAPFATGTVWVTGGTLLLTNDATYLGYFGIGRLTASNVTVNAADLIVGEFGDGTLTIVGGTLNGSTGGFGPLILAEFGGTGTVWVTGGAQLSVLNDLTTIGATGIGQMIVSSGTVAINDVTVGDLGGDAASGLPASAGTLTIAGGTVNISVGQLGQLTVANEFGSTGSVQITSGQLFVDQLSTIIGNGGIGQMQVNGGTTSSRDVWVGNVSGSSGTLTVARGTNTLSSFLWLGVNNGARGALWVTGGQLSVTNDFTIIGSNGIGQATFSNGTALLRDVIVGSGVRAQGTLTVAGGANFISGGLTLGQATTATGSVWLTGSQLIVTNTSTLIGSNGFGQVSVSNGTWMARDLTLALNSGARGTITIAGGTSTFSSLTVGRAASANGALWVKAGRLLVSNGPTILGSNGTASVTVSNGVVAVRDIALGNRPGSAGSLTMAGGTFSAFSNLVVGDCGLGVVGIVSLKGGSLYVTNSSHTAVLDVRDGTLTMSGGSLVVDNLVITNACARFIRTGGTLSISSTNLAPNLSAVGDGIPNGWKQQYGLDPFDPTVGSKDTDSDGFSNLQEFLAGTDPTNSSSAFRITSVSRVGFSIRINWQTAAGKTNAVQRSTTLFGGYSDIYIVTNTVGGVSTFIDLGATASSTPRYYRVRLVQ